MFADPAFWSTEKDNSLFALNRDFLSDEPAQTAAMTARFEGWRDAVLAHATGPLPDYKPETPLPPIPEGIDRIIKLDVFRTLRNPQYQRPLELFLAHCYVAFGDYAQALCLVAAVLRLYLSENDVFKMLAVINASDFYIPGYWKAEAVGYATDAYAIYDILEKHNPRAHQKLAAMHMFPETFSQKFLVALGIHVFPYELLVDVLEHFFKDGRSFLVRLMLAIMDVLEDDIVAAPQINDVYAVLRLDKIQPERMRAIINHAAALETAPFDLPAMRPAIYDKYLKQRLERNDEEFSDEIVFSDETDSDSE